MSGPPPKPASKRRRYNKPASYGAAEPVVAPAADVQERELGIDDPHSLVVSMWAALGKSVESRFFSPADWERARWELWYANKALTSSRPVSGHTWDKVQHGLNELLLSPAIKRRTGIELRPPGPDEDAEAAVLMLGEYRDKLKPV